LNDRVVFLGHRSSETIRDMMNRCRAVVIPSLCYEMFPRTVVEAYSCGRPVIASAHGALDELVEHNVTGVKFRPGDAGDLARCLSLIRECPGPAERLGRAGRAVYESQYTPRKNYEALMEVYRVAAARGGKAAIPYAAQERVLEA
jgi:glycosyltransferase involved in cell wall biosynthesis